MGKLDGKVAPVTGGSKGIGKGTARRLARGGASVVITARGAPFLNQTAEDSTKPGKVVVPMVGDVADKRQVEVVFERLMERFKRIDTLVNNAGAYEGGPLDELSVDVWDKSHRDQPSRIVPLYARRIRIMEKQVGGRIINIGSISAQRPRPKSGPLQRQQVRSLASDARNRARRAGSWNRYQLFASGQRAGGLSQERADGAFRAANGS